MWEGSRTMERESVTKRLVYLDSKKSCHWGFPLQVVDHPKSALDLERRNLHRGLWIRSDRASANFSTFLLKKITEVDKSTRHTPPINRQFLQELRRIWVVIKIHRVFIKFDISTKKWLQNNTIFVVDLKICGVVEWGSHLKYSSRIGIIVPM